MAVYFSDLDIRNFRSCVAANLQLTHFTPLTGLNNWGKSDSPAALSWLARKRG